MFPVFPETVVVDIPALQAGERYPLMIDWPFARNRASRVDAVLELDPATIQRSVANDGRTVLLP